MTFPVSSVFLISIVPATEDIWYVYHPKHAIEMMKKMFFHVQIIKM